MCSFATGIFEYLWLAVSKDCWATNASELSTIVGQKMRMNDPEQKMLLNYEPHLFSGDKYIYIYIHFFIYIYIHIYTCKEASPDLYKTIIFFVSLLT